VIMVGDVLRLGRRLQQKPLIVSTLYPTLVFSAFVLVFYLLEATVRALFRGEGMTGGFAEIASIPFLALKELDCLLGEGKVRTLFWSTHPGGQP